MKNLRQLIRQSGLLSNGKRRRRTEKSRSGVNARPLTSETLEKRELLAGDVLSPQHNYWNSYDVNDDGQITSRDALAIVNQLGRMEAGVAEAELSSTADDDAPRMFYDVNADNSVSALDALGVINALDRGEEVGELVELQLRALRDPADLGSEITDGLVDVNEVFHLEVGYDDLRLFNDRLGVFQLFTDIAVSQPNVLRPVLNETQRIIIGEEFTQSPFPTSITFGLEGSATTVDSTFNDFANNSVGEIERVLTEFGYTDAEFSVESLSFDNNDLGFQISYLGADKGNVDLPDLTVDVNENGGAEVPTQFIEFAPFEADGTTPNSDAVRFNINTFSRTFNDNEQFYSNQNRGAFDSTNGFTGVGGLGQIPSQGGGIPQLTDDGGFIEPFDAFSIPVQIVSQVTNLEISVNPGEDTEATLLYGRDDAVPQDMVLIDDDAVVTLSTIDGMGPAPEFSTTPTALDATEDTAVTVDLSTLLVSGTADTFAVVTDGTRGTSSISGSVLTFIPNMDDNGGDTIIVSGTNSAGTGQGTINVTIAAVNDAPVANPDSFSTNTGTDLTISVNELLSNDTTGADNEADTLTVDSIGATTAGGTATLSGGTITYSPPADTSVTFDSFTYTLSDGTDTATGTVNISIGTVGPVVVLNDGTATVDEDGSVTVDLSTLVASGMADSFAADPGSIGSVSVSGNILTYVPDADEFGDDFVSFTATNSAGTSEPAEIAITVNPINDPPNAVDDAANATVGSSVTINVLDNDDEGADNEDDDLLTVTAVSNVSPNASAVISNGGATIVYTPAAGSGGTSDSFTYTVSDGTDTATATVSIAVVGVSPTAGNGSLAVQENGNATIDLSTLTTGDTPITYTVVTNGTNGNASISGSVLTYTTNPNTGNATDTIEYQAENGSGSGTGTINVTISTGAVNNPPTANNFSASATEDTATSFNAITLSGASANDAGQTLSVSSLGATSNGGTVSIGGNGIVNYTPAADFNGTETFTVTIADNGASPNTVTVTATVNVAAVDDPPTVPSGQTVNAPADGGPVVINVLNGATGGPADEGQNLTVQDVAVSPALGTAVANADGTITFTPNAAASGTATVSFNVSDGNSTTAGSVSVNVQNATTGDADIEGSVFIDKIDNLDRVIFGEAPSRNGSRDAGESGIGGITVRLVASSGTTIASVVTDASGNYAFSGVPQGTHTVQFDLPETINAIGSTSTSVTVDSSGPNREPSLALSGTNNSGLETINILSSSYLRSNSAMATVSNGGREGGLVAMGADGSQSFIIMNEGFDGARYAELILNDTNDAALLVIAREGASTAEVAALSRDQFIVTQNGRGVQFYGDMLNDFDFQPTAGDAIDAEFAGFRDAVDAALAQLG